MQEGAELPQALISFNILVALVDGLALRGMRRAKCMHDELDPWRRSMGKQDALYYTHVPPYGQPARFYIGRGCNPFNAWHRQKHTKKFNAFKFFGVERPHLMLMSLSRVIAWHFSCLARIIHSEVVSSIVPLDLISCGHERWIFVVNMVLELSANSNELKSHRLTIISTFSPNGER